MSRRNENIDNAIWQDEPFALLSAAGKLTFVWSFTNQLCGMAGLYKVRLPQIELDTGQTRGTVLAALEELREHSMVFFLDGILWVVARVKRLVNTTPQIAKSIAKDVSLIPAAHPFRSAFLGWHWESRFPGDELRGRFESEGHPTLTRGSREGHEIAHFIEQYVSLTRGSPDPLSAQCSVLDVRKRSSGPDAREAGDALPADLASHLVEVAPFVAECLTRMAEAKRAKPVTLAAVGRALATYPNHDHRRIAGEVEHYWVHGGGQTVAVRDVVQTYRNRLQRVPAGIVPVPGQARPLPANTGDLSRFQQARPTRSAA